MCTLMVYKLHAQSFASVRDSELVVRLSIYKNFLQGYLLRVEAIV